MDDIMVVRNVQQVQVERVGVERCCKDTGAFLPMSFYDYKGWYTDKRAASVHAALCSSKKKNRCYG